MERLIEKLDAAADALRAVGIALEADQGELPARAAYQLGLARMAVSTAVECFQSAMHAVGGMVPDDFKNSPLSR